MTYGKNLWFIFLFVFLFNVAGLVSPTHADITCTHTDLTTAKSRGQMDIRCETSEGHVLTTAVSSPARMESVLSVIAGLEGIDLVAGEGRSPSASADAPGDADDIDPDAQMRIIMFIASATVYREGITIVNILPLADGSIDYDLDVLEDPLSGVSVFGSSSFNVGRYKVNAKNINNGAIRITVSKLIFSRSLELRPTGNGNYDITTPGGDSFGTIEVGEGGDTTITIGSNAPGWLSDYANSQFSISWQNGGRRACITQSVNGGGSTTTCYTVSVTSQGVCFVPEGGSVADGFCIPRSGPNGPLGPLLPPNAGGPAGPDCASTTPPGNGQSSIILEPEQIVAPKECDNSEFPLFDMIRVH